MQRVHLTKEQRYERMRQLVESKGAKLLSTEYIKSDTKYEIEDYKGRRFLKTWEALNAGEWSHHARSEALTARTRKHTIEDLVEYAKTMNGKCLSTVYTHDKAKYLWEDDEGFQWYASWKTIRIGGWSPNKKRQAISKSRTKYTIEDLKSFAEKSGGKCLSDTYPSETGIALWEDRNGIQFKKSWFNTLKLGDVLYINRSRGQAQLSDWVKNDLGLAIVENERTILKPKHLDIYIPAGRIAIEYHGLYWHTTRKINKNLHRDKASKCLSSGVRLIQVFEHEWKDRNSQVKSFLRSALGKNESKVFARKCRLVNVEPKKANEFLELYHIQGGANVKKAYGLEHNGELLMLISIGVHHRNGSEIVLNRCVSKTGTTVIGGLSRLCKAALGDFPSISTWVDLRWSTGESWIKLGWKLDRVLPPDYFYYQEKEKKVISKQSRKKSLVNTPANMTEKEHAKQDGMFQIYDAGKIKLTLSR